MKLNHLNLTVTDVPAAAHFLETYFGLRSQGATKGSLRSSTTITWPSP